MVFSETVLANQIRRQERSKAIDRKRWEHPTEEMLARQREKNRRAAQRRKAGLIVPRPPSMSTAQRIINRYEADRARRQGKKAWVDAYKREHPCVDCGYSDIRALQFDHRDPTNKRHHISALVKRGASIEVIIAEIAKCDVRCANCHFIRSHEEGHHLLGNKKAA